MKREEHVTATGWRLVGKAAQLVREDAQFYGPDVLPGRDEDVLFGAKFRVQPRLGTQRPVPAVLAILDAAVRREWDAAPPLTEDRQAGVPAGRFHGLHWRPEGTSGVGGGGGGGAWRGELRWRHRHPVIAGAPCTTHVVLVEQGSLVTLALRVTADRGLASVRGTVGAGQARPAFLSELNRSLRLATEWGSGEPRVLSDQDVEGFVRDTLLSESREHPVVVISPLESGGYALPLETVAEELLGLAPLYAIDRHAATFRLSDAVGDRRLSCYWGAMRVYMGDFSCADRPEEHPLLVHERLQDPVMRASILGVLGRAAGRRYASHFEATVPEAGVAASVGEPEGTSDARDIYAPAAGASSIPQSAPADGGGAAAGSAAAFVELLAPVMRKISDGIMELRQAIGALTESNASLNDEMVRLRTTTAVRSASTASLERRIDGLERLLRQALGGTVASAAEAIAGETKLPGTDAEGEVELGDEQPSVLEIVRQAGAAHPDALLVLDAAEHSAGDTPYEDVERLEAVLNAMAAVARRRQEGALGVPLRQAFRELGIDYRGGIPEHTSGRLQQQYVVTDGKGRSYECVEHIAMGSSYDPRHCLRIYFTSRSSLEPRFVIGHVGRHFEVASSS